MRIEDIETYLTSSEARIVALEAKIEKLFDKIDLLLEAEAERKALDRVFTKYGKAMFWAIVSIGGLINWDKIVHAADGLLAGLPH